MPRADGRIEPGQPISSAISARAWNRAQDAADIVLGDRYSIAGESSGGGLKPYTWAYCKAGVTVPRWGVLAITGVEITPTSTDSDTATRSFHDCPVLTGGTPSETTTAWCVAVEPIESGKVGRVAVAGVVQCKLTVGDSSHKFARAKASTSELETATSGEGLVLWKGGGWALVRLGIVDLTKYSGWNGSAQQVFGHNEYGQLVWLNTTACT